MNGQGLANTVPATGQAQGAQMLEQAIAMLMEGARPEDLAQMGIPMEVIEAAVAQMSQMAQAEQAQMSQGGGGLAATQGLAAQS